MFSLHNFQFDLGTSNKYFMILKRYITVLQHLEFYLQVELTCLKLNTILIENQR
jgi:hypothetical protein